LFVLFSHLDVPWVAVAVLSSNLVLASLILV
jgi:hypothetical protein